jgi:uncharacterized metal-binding protein
MLINHQLLFQTTLQRKLGINLAMPRLLWLPSMGKKNIPKAYCSTWVCGLIAKVLRLGIILLAVGIIILFAGMRYISSLDVSASQFLSEIVYNSWYENLLYFMLLGGILLAVGLGMTIAGAVKKPKKKILSSREEDEKFRFGD